MLSNPTGAGLGTQSTSSLIIYDYEEGAFDFDLTTQDLYEDIGNVALTITRSGGTDGEVTVNYATVDGTATAGVDYTASSATLTFATGETTKTVYIPILNDAIIDGGESFSVILSSPTNGARLGAQANTVLTLNDSIGDPTATTMTAGFVIIEDAGAQATPDIVVTNPQIDEEVTVSLTLVDPVTGSFSANDGAIFDSQTGKWSITGLTATVNTALVNLQFTPAPDHDTDITVATSVKDVFGNGPTDGVWTLLMENSAITRISSNMSGQEANAHSYRLSMNADGRYTAFISDASDLVPNDTNNLADVFLYDNFSNEIKRISVSENGVESDGVSIGVRISRSGRYVVFATNATNFLPGLDGGLFQVVMKDLVTGTFTLISQAMPE